MVAQGIADSQEATPTASLWAASICMPQPQEAKLCRWEDAFFGVYT